MRVLFVSHASEKYGAGRSLLALIDGLSDQGVTCSAVLPRDGPLVAELVRRHVEYTFVPLKRWASRDTWIGKRILRGWFNLLVSVIIAAKARGWQADVIYTNSSVTPVGALAALLAGRPHIWHVREFGREDHGLCFDLGFEKSARMMARLSSRLIVVSEALRAKYARCVCSKGLRVIYNPVNAETEAGPLVPSARKPAADIVPRRRPLVAIVGAIHPGKGQIDAVLAIKQLVQRDTEVDLRIVGDGEADYLSQLKRTVIENDLGQYVEFTGFIDDPMSVMKAADLVLVCSRSEAFGRVTIESMLSGTPVIGTRSGATAELIKEGFNGLLYEPGNHQELAQRIQYLVAHPEESAQMAQNGFEWASQRFTVARHADEVLDVLQTAVQTQQNKRQCAR